MTQKAATRTKFAAVFLCLLLCASAALSGCGSGENDEIIGSWIPTTATTNGQDVPYSELGIEDGQFALEFKNSTDCTVTLAGISTDTTYVFNGTSVDLTVNGTDYKLGYGSGTLSLEFNYNSDAMTLTFTKQR